MHRASRPTARRRVPSPPHLQLVNVIYENEKKAVIGQRSPGSSLSRR